MLQIMSKFINKLGGGAPKHEPTDLLNSPKKSLLDQEEEIELEGWGKVRYEDSGTSSSRMYQIALQTMIKDKKGTLNTIFIKFFRHSSHILQDFL